MTTQKEVFMKVISAVIPCYNSEAYMEKAINTLLSGGTEMEIIVVDDGSSDNTLAIAKRYEAEYPEIVKAVHKENGGHGDAVMTGLAHAEGLYFKVVDSDDWVKESALTEILQKIQELLKQGTAPDMLVANYVYEKVGEEKKKVIRYHGALPQNELFAWGDTGHFRQGQYILMHSVIYRTALLRECGLSLPKHTFYVDNIFVYQPLPSVKTMYYMDVNLYRYFIGRDDQSVTEENMVKRIDQQVRVTKIMIEAHDIWKIRDKKLRNYMMKYLCIMMTVSSIYLLKSGTEENLAKKQELWEYLKAYDKRLYRKISMTILGTSSKADSKAGQSIFKAGYEVARKIFKFN